MKYNKLKLVYFSPAGTTKRTLENIASGCGITDVEKIDITDFDLRWKPRKFEPGELVLIGMPVYAGRIPAPAALYFNTVEASAAACVPVVVYGNREYDDALLELKMLAQKSGFYIAAAAAFIAEHSLCSSVAEGRPDEDDRIFQAEFGSRVVSKLEVSGMTENTPEVPGNYPYKTGMDIPLSPEADDRCTLCGKCVAVCPVKAIDPRNPTVTDQYRCILCGACIKECPENARKMLHPDLLKLVKSIESIGNKRKLAEIFI